MDAVNEGERISELWIYGGYRFSGNKLCDAWVPCDSDGKAQLNVVSYFERGKGRKAGSFAVGCEYEATVTREGGVVTLHGVPTYTRKHWDSELNAQLAAKHQAARITADRNALEASAKRANPIDEALNPLIDLYKNVPYPQRDAFVAYVLRRMLNA